MKRVFFLIVGLALVLALLPAAASASMQAEAFVTDLIAGQHTVAGQIKIWNDSQSIYVQYQTRSPYCLMETDLQIASSLEGIPQSNGNPIPGRFDYKNSFNCRSQFLYTVPLHFSSCDLYVAAHAVINTGDTAWGAGPAFDGKNWATYMLYHVEGCGEDNQNPSPTYTSTASATATFTPTSTKTSTPTSTSAPDGGPTKTFTPTSTQTATATFTATPTTTATTTIVPECQPVVVTGDFSQLMTGTGIEGMGAVAPNLSIDAKGTTVKIDTGVQPTLYGTRNNGGTINGELAPGGGFSDKITETAKQAPLYTFTFAPGTWVSNFSVHMIDFGDLNPTLSSSHVVTMTAYDANNIVIDVQQLSYNTPPSINPTSSDLYGNLSINGDGTAAPGMPGNWTWNVTGPGIVKVVLEFGAGYDPNIGFDRVRYITGCQACTSYTINGDFSQLLPGRSIEGMGVAAPGLAIDAKGTTVKIDTGVQPTLYGTRNNGGTINGELAPGGGFSDKITETAKQAPLYTFTFAPGTSITNFSLHMIDFGDLNPTLSSSHVVTMTAYDANNAVIDVQQLSYNTPPSINPTSSDLYGNLSINGDGTAAPGMPGNWTWDVKGIGIVKVVLKFGAGYDPNIGFDKLSFTINCPP